MNKKTKLIAGAAVIAAALVYMIYAGVTQSAVYFVTPSELQAAPVAGKAYRLGGLVSPGSLKWEPRTLDLAFSLTDGKATIPIRHKGTAPDLFGEGRGAVVEGSWTPDGYFKASLIMAKHSEEYRAPEGDSAAGYRELMKSLQAGSQKEGGQK
jgi:cytochrome c-type biogenesis protein CcmE